MLRYIYADDLSRAPKLARTMFRDRGEQFHTRLNWKVTVAGDGSERDEYDALNTRFCLAPGADTRVSAALMLGGMEAGRASFLTHAVGVFDARMVRVYRRLSWGPIILGTCGTGRDAISVGLWAFQEDGVRARLLDRVGVSSGVSEGWLTQSLDGIAALDPAIA